MKKDGADVKKCAKNFKEEGKEVTEDAAAAVERGARDVKEDAKK